MEIILANRDYYLFGTQFEMRKMAINNR